MKKSIEMLQFSFMLQSRIIFHDLRFPQMLEEVIKASNETIFLTEEQYVLVVDLFIFRPELQLEVTGLSQKMTQQDCTPQLVLNALSSHVSVL